LTPFTGLKVSRESLEALELGSLLRLVADDASSDVGRQRVLGLSPLADAEALAEAIGRGREVDRLLDDGALVTVLDDPLLPVFETLEEGRIDLDGPHLVGLRHLLRATRSAVGRIESSDPECEVLAAMAHELPDLSELHRRLDRSLDDRGRVRDEASPRLLSLRRRSQRVRQAAYRKLEAFVRSHGEDLAEDTVPLHEDRLVVLLRSGSKGRLAGLVHGRSGSGQSFYFEPLEVVESNNELREVHDDEEAERSRILRALVEETLQHHEALAAHLTFLAELDLAQAAARWGRRCDGLWVVPGDDPEYRLVAARHPLLDPRLADLRERALGQAGHAHSVEPLSVELGSSGRVLVVTGPNAGGKTVALKTLGLIALLVHCGLPVPVGAGTEVPLLKTVVATVGDEQDMLTDRSTFSSRLLRLKEAWESAGSRSLVLLDELGSGTDPEEGAALSVALIEGLVEKRALAAVSSHLTRVATAALDLAGASCAAMAFDADSGLPTYCLVPGTPGSSEALALARRLELPDAWVERAERLLGPEHGQLQMLLAEVEKARAKLVSELRETREKKGRLEEELRLSEAAREEMERATRESAETTRKAVRELRRDVQRRLREEVERLREEFSRGRGPDLARKAAERILIDAPAPEPRSSGIPVEPGGRVKHRSLGWEGTVEKIERGRAHVSVAGKRVLCSVEDLDGLSPESGKPKSEVVPVSVAAPSADEAPAVELNLLGERVEDALAELAAYLDRVLLAGASEVRIVHGHGTGRLKTAVRAALEETPVVARWRPGKRGEGGDGATVVTLAG
jgi:DNA mismatch repair protein MutS2